VFDISIQSGGGYITSFDGGLVTVSLTYALKAGEEPSGVTVWYLDGVGNLEKLPCEYDERTKTVRFTTSHLSTYAIGYDAAAAELWANPFADVKESDWFYGDVRFAVSGGLFSGASAAAFSPNEPMTRGMLATVLGRLENISVGDAAPGVPFTDVAAERYYAPYIAWAAENGLVSGVGDNRFAPDAVITRQDMAVILARYAEFAELQFPVTLQYAGFEDDGEIADYAKNAVQILFCGGIVNGKPGDRFDPRGGATRVEVAATLHRFVDAAEAFQ
jgi:hypothetical protein